eukprot:TRINITY_DN28111_c0_g1_i7.p1 TRINITY_DN28111_c0_g1~~TRINITY_DN28111_c0_g1_i7.p1  ORF type:complete len:220 (+),score=63.28 TRINITY_DN28111_c0_g1_i7:142-801(+)
MCIRDRSTGVPVLPWELARLARESMPSRPPAVSFRAAQEADMRELEALQKKLFPVQYTEQFYKDLLKPHYHTILAHTTNDSVLVLVGAVTALREVDDGKKKQTSSVCSSSPLLVYIMTLGVASSHRGQGIGSTLLRKIVEGIPADSYSLHMKMGNEAALSMYLNFGFQVTRDLPAHYSIEGKSYDAMELVYTPPGQWYNMVQAAVIWLGTPLARCWYKN